ncbi:MAG TPA: DUF4234 domain-containing protein [Candidatus Kapabacteria bacterium]|nr:DUF4234 domain-containing protein [Candidatus Kapabacteria bacterium]
MEETATTPVATVRHKYRNPIAVFFLPMITFGIYSIVWYVKTKEEMRAEGADIPTAWFLLIPFVNIYWMIQYCKGVEKTSNGKNNTWIAFLLLFLTGCIGMAIIQTWFNDQWGLKN